MAAYTRSLGTIADFPASGLKEVELARTRILLVRQGESVSAIGATCPHAGAPLAQGVLAAGSVICPWHKAAFDVVTGRCTAPPAVDDVTSYKIHVIDGEMFLGGQDEGVSPRARGGEDRRRFVIIGAGGAGFSAAQELRRRGFAGEIVLLDAEGVLPYDRTIQSKYVLAGTEAGEKSPLQDEAFFQRERIERRRVVVRKLDAREKRITLRDGQVLTYDVALVATGAAVAPLPFAGAELAGVFGLRSKNDAGQIAAAAAHARRAVIIGASFIGMEAAAALRERGLEVTVVAPERVPFETQLGAEVGRVFRSLHEEKGVKFALGSQVKRLVGERAVSGVELVAGDVLPADLVVAGVGVKPATQFVTGVAQDEAGGLIAGPDLRIAEGLYAAGDVAVFPLSGDGESIRVEHWRVAEQQGRVAARAMLGEAVVFDAVPVFWTIQYMQRLDYVGHASGDDEIEIRGSLETREFIAYYLRDGVVKAAAGMNRDAEMAAVLALMTARRDWRLEDLHPAAMTPLDVLNRQEGRA